MRLEQIIRSTMTEAADMDGRLDQLVRAGLMPTSSLPLLKRAISRMHAGMSLQGAERDVMNMFINSMMFIVLGDDTVFNKARAGAKTYATEAKEKQEYDYEGDMAMSQLKSIIANSQRMHDMLGEDTNLPEWVQSKITLAEDYLSTASNYMQGEMNEETDLEENAKIVAHLSKRYGDNIRKSHVVSAANDFGVDASKLAKAVRKKLGKTMLGEEEQIDELSKATMGRYVNKAATKMGSQGVTAGLKIAADEKSSKNFKDMGKREKGIKLAVKKLTKEDVEQIDELSNRTLGSYVKKAKKELSSSDYHVGRAVGARETGQKSNFSPELERKLTKRGKKRYHGIDKAVDKMMTKEESEQIDEISKTTLGSYVKKASGAEQPKNVMSPKNVPLTKIAAYQGDSETGHFGKRFNQHTYDKAERLRKNRETGIKRAVDKLTKEEVEITEASVADVAKTAHLHVRAGKHDSIHTAIKSAVDTHFPASVHSSVTRKKVAAQALNRIQSSNAAKMTKEEVEQVDEISKAMAGRYVKKAAASIDLTAWRQGYKEAGAGNPSKHLEKKLSKRHKGIETAVKKLTKEDIDAVKKMNESYKTAFQTALNEYGIKSPSELDESKRKEFFNHVDLEFKKGDN